MRRLVAVTLAAMMVLSLAACGEEQEAAGHTEPPQNGTEDAHMPDTTPESTPSEPSEAPESGKKILVAYFSAANNTEGIAQKLADGLGADLYEITPSEPYTDADLDYGDSKSRSSAGASADDVMAWANGLGIGF